MIWIIRLSKENQAVRVALAAGLALLALALAARLSRVPLVLARTNVTLEAHLAVRKGETTFCQSHETLPSGTSALRLWISVNVGPQVTVAALSGSRVLAEGVQGPGWTGDVVTIPISPVPRRSSIVTVCTRLGPLVEPISLAGGRPRQSIGGAASSELKIEYLRPGRRSWWAQAGSVAHRLGLDRAPGGAWVALVPIALMAAAAVLTAWLVLRQLGARREALPSPIAGAQLATPPRPAPPTSLRSVPLAPGRRRALGLRATLGEVPSTAWACAAVAVLSAASWSILTPPFQVPDEPSHFAYVQQLAEAQALPKYSTVSFSPQERKVLEGLNHKQVRFNPAVGTLSTPAQRHTLEHDLALPLARRGLGEAGVATAEPPLYYALQTIPYLAASYAGGNLLDQLTLMRLLSALMAGLTAFFTYLFLCEALPGARWAWTVGGLGVALFPLLGFISGGVNPDAMLFTVSAALFFCLARAFRRGLTPASAAAIGAMSAVGLLTKLNFIGLVPGVAIAMAVLSWRAVRAGDRRAYRSLAAGCAIAALPVGVYTLSNLIRGHPFFGDSASGFADFGAHGSVGTELSYIWQSYLPRLPGMVHYFPGLDTTRLWFDRSIGLYGWLDTYFPNWVYTLALLPTAVIAILCVRALVAERAALRARIGELLAYAAIAAGLLALIGVNSYLKYPGLAMDYAEPRYLLPLAALFGALLALAARGAGRVWGPVAGTLIIVLVLGHDIFSQLLLVSRYYG